MRVAIFPLVLLVIATLAGEVQRTKEQPPMSGMALVNLSTFASADDIPIPAESGSFNLGILAGTTNIAMKSSSGDVFIVSSMTPTTYTTFGFMMIDDTGNLSGRPYDNDTYIQPLYAVPDQAVPLRMPDRDSNFPRQPGTVIAIETAYADEDNDGGSHQELKFRKVDVLLAENVTVDLNSGTAQEILASRTGWRPVVTRVAFHTATGAAEDASASVGVNGSAYTDILGDTSLSNLTDLAKTVTRHLTDPEIPTAAADVMLQVNTLAGAAAGCKVDLIGYWKPE